jgi:hypothetical protein
MGCRWNEVEGMKCIRSNPGYVGADIWIVRNRFPWLNY